MYLKLTDLIGANFTSREFAKQIIIWQQAEESFAEELDIAARYAAYRVYLCEGIKPQDNILFNLPQKLDKENLIDDKKILKYQKNERVDFDYTDSFLNLDEALNHSHYCIYCHKQDKDSCSKGLLQPQNRHCEERSDVAISGDLTSCHAPCSRSQCELKQGCPFKTKNF